ncbi:MAG TPA: amidohydrolase family protein [Acidimicrobiia bacterium]|nr:amidohydrolase family protein [Acidimicrobiia bacterium]
MSLPFGVGPETNGEFVPAPGTHADLDVAAATLAEIDAAARRHAIDRRAFLRGAGGVAASLTVFNACAKASHRAASTTTRPTHTSPPTSAPGGTFSVPSTTDVVACEHALSGDEFVFDVHSHHLMPDGPWRHTAPDTVQLVGGMLPDCNAADPFDCADRANYLHDMFVLSDTTVAMLTDVPNSGPDDAPLPFSDALATQTFADQLTRDGASRVLVQNVIAPNFGDLHARLDGMTATAATRKVAAFKVYTAWGPDRHGFALDDPALGLPVVQHAHDLGVRVFVAHKGLPLVDFDTAHNGPEDVVAVSRLFPDMQFVIFHANWQPGHHEGVYNPTDPVGVDRLLVALDAHHVQPNSNVWVDLASVWRSLLRHPDQAAHLLGKLLGRVGLQRVLWGTDSVWYGPPQSQIMAFRAFEISAELQDRYDYPALTDAVKRDVLGLNAARLFDIDADATRCALAADSLAAAPAAAAAVQPTRWSPRGPTTRRDMLAWLATPSTRWTPG